MEDIKVSMYEIDLYYISITLSLITKIYPNIIRYNKIRYHKRNISYHLHIHQECNHYHSSHLNWHYCRQDAHQRKKIIYNILRKL